tara:strand:+ start:2336 stop:3016 length:681 start_codon:yes stop_codon:yes gene_type:complete
MTLIALIPARRGSKGIPNKNLREFKGQPLIAWTINQALSSTSIDRVIVSTEDEEIAEIAKKFGAEIPFLRPNNLANDSSLVIETVIHAINNLNDVNDILLMQPTSPLRRVEDIDNIVELRKKFKGQSAASLVKVSEYPQWMYSLDNQNMYPFLGKINSFERRQNLKKIHILNGSLYLSSKKHLIENGSFISNETIPYIMPPKFSVDIDEEIDWVYAEFLYDKINKL